MSGRYRGRLAPLILAALGAAGCVSSSAVDRSYGGDVVRGRFIEPDAYASFLAGAIAEAAGDWGPALASYARAERLDPGGPEIWTRIAAVRCAANPHDPRAGDALARALAVDDRYAAAWKVKATCALARGDEAAAEAAALRAARLQTPAEAEALVSRVDPRPGDEAVRRRLLEITVTASNRAAAFRALAVWGEAHDDAPLWSSALIALAKIGSLEQAEIAHAAEALAGAGAIAEARAVAAAMVDAFDEPPPAGARGLAARLALDEAIARRDIEALRRRAVRTRLGLDEAAARACLSDDRASARALASEVAHADPADLGARLILAALESGDALRIGTASAAGTAPVSGAVWVAFATALARVEPPDLAGSAIARIAHEPIAPGDERVIRAAVVLASRGYAQASALPPDGLVELRALGVESGIPEGRALPGAGELDAIHRYLALALSRPGEARTRELGARLARVVPEDRLVAVARSLVLLRSGAPITPSSAQALLARDPTDPLVAATALRLAEKAGDASVARHVRAAVDAIAGVRATTVIE